MEITKEMYAQEPILATICAEMLVFTLLIPLIMRLFFKKWDKKRIEECEQSAMKIWDADTTEDKRYAWAYADSLAKSTIKRNTRKPTYNYRKSCGRR